MNVIIKLFVAMSIKSFAESVDLSIETLVPTKPPRTTTPEPTRFLNTRFMLHGPNLGLKFLKYLLIQAKIYGLRGYAMQTAYESSFDGVKGRMDGSFYWVEEMKHWLAASRCPGGLVEFTEWWDEEWSTNFTYEDFHIYDEENKIIQF